jgi:hypothetical protein
MARTTARLTALQVTRAVGKPGMYADGDGLYLQVTEGGASWINVARLPQLLGKAD